MNLSTMTIRDLELLLEKQKALLADNTIVDKLPDKGERIKSKVQQILAELENKKKQESEIQTIATESTKQQYISAESESRVATTLWDKETEIEIKQSLKLHTKENIDNNSNKKHSDEDIDWLEKKMKLLEVKGCTPDIVIYLLQTNQIQKKQKRSCYLCMEEKDCNHYLKRNTLDSNHYH